LFPSVSCKQTPFVATQLPPDVKGKPKLDTDAMRVAFLFVLYRHLGSLFGEAVT
jgi:hypothetical protein